ncbi:unnamed protein product, partial [Allacma fusca]
LIIQT